MDGHTQGMRVNSTRIAPATITTPTDTGDNLPHLYCNTEHGSAPDATSLCGAKRNRPHGRKMYLTEAERRGFCVVCIDIAKTQNGLCQHCAKGKS